MRGLLFSLLFYEMLLMDEGEEFWRNYCNLL